MDVHDLSPIDEENQDNWTEGSLRVKDVNDAGRVDEGMICRWYLDYRGDKVAAGGPVIFTVASETKPTDYYDGFQLVLAYPVNNEADATLNVDSKGAIPLLRTDGTAVRDDDIIANVPHMHVYVGGSFYVSTLAPLGTAGKLDAGSDVGEVIVWDDLDPGGTPTPGYPAGDGSQLTNLATVPTTGEVQLAYTNATTLTLSPYNGNRLVINTAADTPAELRLAAPITLDATGLAANTSYFIYAAWSDPNIVLSASTTAPSTDANGFQVKSDDPLLSLVGYARTNASAQFAQSETEWFVRSLFNDLSPSLARANTTADISIGTSWGQVGGLQVQLLVLPGDRLKASFTGTVTNPSGTWAAIGIGFDATPTRGSSSSGQSGTVAHPATAIGGRTEDTFGVRTITGYARGNAAGGIFAQGLFTASDARGLLQVWI